MKTEELAVIQESGAALIAMANHHGVENQQAVRAGVRDIPGVKIYQKETAVFG